MINDDSSFINDTFHFLTTLESSLSNMFIIQEATGSVAIQIFSDS